MPNPPDRVGVALNPITLTCCTQFHPHASISCFRLWGVGGGGGGWWQHSTPTHDFVGNFTLIKTSWTCHVYYSSTTVCSSLPKPVFPFCGQKKRRLMTAVCLSSELCDLLPHIWKDMDKSSAAQMKKDGFGSLFHIYLASTLFYYIYIYIYIYFFPQNFPSLASHHTHIITWCEPFLLKKKKSTALLPSAILPVFTLWSLRHKYSFLSEPVVHTEHRGAALQPLGTTTDPELLQWAPLGQG